MCPYSEFFQSKFFCILNEIWSDKQYLSVDSPNAGKYGQEKLRMRSFLTQCESSIYFLKTILLASLKLTVSLSQIVSFSQVYFLFLLSMKNYFIINNDNNNNSTDNKQFRLQQTKVNIPCVQFYQYPTETVIQQQTVRSINFDELYYVMSEFF